MRLAVSKRMSDYTQLFLHGMNALAEKRRYDQERQRQGRLDEAHLKQYDLQGQQMQMELENKRRQEEAQKALANFDLMGLAAPASGAPDIGPPQAPVKADLQSPFHAQAPEIQQAMLAKLAPTGINPVEAIQFFNQAHTGFSGRPVLPSAPPGMKMTQLKGGEPTFEPDLPLPPGAIPESYRQGDMTYKFPSAQQGPAHIQPVIGPDGRAMPGLFTGPDGKPHPLPRNAAPTEAQSNAKIYSERLAYNEKVLEELGKKYDPTSLARLPQEAPFGLGDGVLRVARSDAANQYIDAKKNWIAAVLRKESGAAISDSEYSNADKQYFPQVGDGPEAIRQKAEMRKLVQQQMGKIGNPPQVELPFGGGEDLPPPPGAQPSSAPSSSPDAPVAIQTRAQFNALPSGTFFAWNGKVGRKK